MRARRSTGPIRNALRWIVRAALVLLAIVIAVFAFYRLRGPSPAQQAALALMQADYRPAQGRNAFALLWFARYDVPVSDRGARLAAEVADVRGRLASAQPYQLVEHAPAATVIAEAPLDPRSTLCSAAVAGCLALARSAGPAMRTVVAAHPAANALAGDFAATDYYWDEFPDDYRLVETEVAHAPQALWLSAFALRYVDGDRAGALADTCRNIAAWRRSQAGNNTVLGAMLAQSNADAGLSLFADMLADLPADVATPSECTDALQPVAAPELDRCAQMATEFARHLTVARTDAAAAAQASWWDRAQRWVFIGRPTGVHQAEALSDYCGDAARQRMLADAAPTPFLPWQRLDCVADAIGCVLAGIAVPAYVDYDRRTLDFAAHLRLAATALWLREHPGNGSLEARFARRPPALRSNGHLEGIDVARGRLFVENVRTRHEARFELPVSAPAPAP